MKDLKHGKMKNKNPLRSKMLPIFLGLFCLLAVSQIGLAQQKATLTTSAVVLPIDDNYVDEKQNLLEAEMLAVRNDNQMDDNEKQVRLKLLAKAGELIGQGVLIEDSWNIAYRILVDRVQSRFPNIPFKSYVAEYKDKF